jgi:5-methylcytosine-specific restriction endonuclease McrA
LQAVGAILQEMGAGCGTTKWKRRQKQRLLHRDGARCWLCNRPLCDQPRKRAKQTTLEHLQPRCAGGGNALENLVLCHEACNRHLGDRPPEKKREIRIKWHAETARVLASSAARRRSGA